MQPADLKRRVRRRSRRIWRWFLEFALTVTVLWVSLMFAGRVLPKIALRQISELTNTRIKAEGVDFRFDGSLNITNLSVWPKITAGYDNSILKAEKVNVRFRMGSLIRMKPRLKEIYVDDFTLKALYDSDSGEWNLSALKTGMPKGSGERLPRVWFENGSIEYVQVSHGHGRREGSWPVSAGFRPADKTVCDDGYSFDISSAGRQNFEKSLIVGSWCPGRVTIGGRISSKDIPGFGRQWDLKKLDAEMIYEPNGFYELTAKVKDFNCPPSESGKMFTFETKSIAEKAPFIDALQKFFIRYNPSGTIDSEIRSTGNLARIIESRIAGTVYCNDVSVRDKEFPYKVEHITGMIKLTERSATFEKLTGRHKDVDLDFAGWAKDFGANWKYLLQITSNNMLLDKDLYNALKEGAQRFWTAFSPSGVVAINYSRSRLSPTDKQTALAVELLDVESKYIGFEYPLKNTRGKLFFEASGIDFSDVISQWEGRKITINGDVEYGKGDKPIYDVLVESENIPLDSTLEEALPERQKDIYNQFEMAGIIDATIKISSSQDDNVATFTAEVFPKGSTIKARALPIVISDVRGKIVFEPEKTDIEKLTGRYERGTVELSGNVWPAEKERDLNYCLSMRAQSIDLNEELIEVLPGSLGGILTELKPGGEVNFTADLGKDAKGDCSGNRLIVECLGNTIDCDLLPYPLRDVSGQMTIKQNRIELEDITARAMHKVRGEPVESTMKMNGNIVLGGEQADGKSRKITAGELEFSGEHVRLKGKTLDRLDTSLVYESESKTWISQHFIADFYDGKMIGKLQFEQFSEGGLGYFLEASVAGADLEKFLSDRPEEKGPEEHYSTGTINGSLSLVGSLGDDNIRLGRCRLKIIEMEVGKLSPLAKLLTVLNLTEPGDYAFDQMLVDAYIQDNKVFFRQMDLSGKSLAFNGSGWLDLKTDDINLMLTARGRRLATKKPSIFESLTEGLGRAVVRVEVSGNANDPKVATKTLPVIGETLEILGTPRGN